MNWKLTWKVGTWSNCCFTFVGVQFKKKSLMIAQKINIYPWGFVQVLEERNDNKFLSSRYYRHPSFSSSSLEINKWSLRNSTHSKQLTPVNCLKSNFKTLGNHPNGFVPPEGTLMKVNVIQIPKREEIPIVQSNHYLRLPRNSWLNNYIMPFWKRETVG